jgi:hypothetical protein
MRLIAAAIGVVLIAAPVKAQGLGEAAEREKERQQKVREGGTAKVITLEDLKANTGKLANDPSIPPAVAATPVRTGSRLVAAPVVASAAGGGGGSVGSGPEKSSETSWRSSVRAARQNIARLEAEVKTLDAKATGLAYGVATSGAPPNVKDGNGSPVFRETPGQRQAREGSNAVAQLAWQKERAEVLDSLERARSALVKAKADLETLEESARRQGVPPGWLRE